MSGARALLLAAALGSLGATCHRHTPEKRMNVAIPFGNVQDCHDELRGSPELWRAFREELLPIVQGGEPPWTVVQPTLTRADEIWTRYLGEEQSSPREFEGVWRCVVIDVVEALVDATVRGVEASDLPAEEKRRTLAETRELVEPIFAETLSPAVFSLLEAEQRVSP